MSDLVVSAIQQGAALLSSNGAWGRPACLPEPLGTPNPL